VEIGVDGIVDPNAEPMTQSELEDKWERAIAADMSRGVVIPELDDHRHHESVRQAERDMDISLILSVGAVGIGAAGIYIWKKRRNKE
jgi:hypothetical protein